MEGFGIAAMGDHSHAVDVRLIKAVRHAVEVRERQVRLRMHQLRRRRLENPVAVILAVLEVGDHEPSHVLARRSEAPRGRRADEFVTVGLVLAGDVPLGHQRLKVGRQRLSEGCVLHAQWREDMPRNVRVERLARDALDDVAGEARAIVRISWSRSRRVYALGHPSLQEGVERYVIFLVKRDQVLDRFLETRRVRHQVEHSDGLTVIGRDFEVDVLVDVRVEIDFAELDLLHHRGPGEELGNRSGAEQRRCWIDFFPFGNVGVAVAARRKDLPVLDDDHDGAGNIAFADGIRNKAVEPRIDVVGGQGVRTLLRTRRRSRESRAFDLYGRDQRRLSCLRGRSREERSPENCSEKCSRLTHVRLPFSWLICPIGQSGLIMLARA